MFLRSRGGISQGGERIKNDRGNTGMGVTNEGKVPQKYMTDRAQGARWVGNESERGWNNISE